MSHVNSLSKLKAFDEAKYSGLSADHCLTYAMKTLEENDIPRTFENIVVAGYRLFPSKFSLVGFLEYPDAARVNRTLLHGFPNYGNWVRGRAKEGYSLAKKGEVMAKQAAEKMKAPGGHQMPQGEKDQADRTNTGTRKISELQEKNLYKLWSSGKGDEAGPYDIWDFLEAAPYTEKRTITSILKQINQAASLAKDKDMQTFLKWLSERYKSELEE